MLQWIKPDHVSVTDIMKGGYLLQKGDVSIGDKYIVKCLTNDLSPLKAFMTQEAWLSLMEDKKCGMFE